MKLVADVVGAPPPVIPVPAAITPLAAIAAEWLLRHWGQQAKVEGNEDAQKAAAAGRIKQYREDTREKRMAISNEAHRRFERPISWGVKYGDKTFLFTHLSVPVMTRLRQKERMVLDSLVDAGVARSRSEAVAWCVRLVEEHEGDWLKELREAMSKVAQVRSGGPLN